MVFNNVCAGTAPVNIQHVNIFLQNVKKKRFLEKLFSKSKKKTFFFKKRFKERFFKMLKQNVFQKTFCKERFQTNVF